jgi:5-methylcytosine-specific restriction enzyme subunit McrC
VIPVLSVRLREYGAAVEERLSAEEVEALRETKLVFAEYVGAGRYRLKPSDRVGMARTVQGVEIAVDPKLTVARLVYLLGYSSRIAWRPELLAVPEDEDLLPAVARVLASLGEQALVQGVLQGYRTVEEPAATVRGRLLIGQQVRRRAGLALPVECRFDDWGVDIPENRLLLAGVTLARALPGVPDDVRRRLHRLERMLDGVTRLPWQAQVPRWQPSRLNLRYQPALRMAEVILRNASAAALPAGRLQFHGFVVSMAEVFESFLSATLGPALERYGGTVEPQKSRPLDVEQQLKIRPDLLWLHGSAATAVIDAKYKATDRVYNPDAYQMLTYCVRLGLPVGHLVYAAGEEPQRTYTVVGTRVRILQHTLDLAAADISTLHASIDALAAKVHSCATAQPPAPGTAAR